VVVKTTRTKVVQYGEEAPSYFRHGVLPLPVSAASAAHKRPAVIGWSRAGSHAALSGMHRFTDAPAIGIALGARSDITILDLDTTDEREVSRAMGRHGRTPLVARTRSGGHQLWYRHRGEPRLIRPWGKTLPVDLLGRGFAIVPPSLDGAYSFVAGDLDDLDRLPAMQGLEGVLPRPATTGATSERIGHGRRTDALWRHAMRHAPFCDTKAALIDVALSYRLDALDVSDGHAFTEREAIREAHRAWALTEAGRNYIGGSADIEPLTLADHPEAFLLWHDLQRNHAGRREEFVLCSVAMARRLGWGTRRFRQARDRLVRDGWIECVHPGGRGQNDPPRYCCGSRLPKQRARAND
jgi:hypothetical protein